MTDTSELQQRAQSAATSGDAGALSKALEEGATLTIDVQRAARRNASPAMNTVLFANGWPADRTLAGPMALDLGRGIDMVQWYLENGAPYEESIYPGAALFANLDVMKLLRQYYGIPFAGTGALTAAAWSGKIDIVQWLIEQGEEDLNVWPKQDPVDDARECRNATPLHRAVQKGRVDVVRLLLRNGADPMIANQAGTVPWESAVMYADEQHQTIVSLLEEHQRQHVSSTVVQ